MHKYHAEITGWLKDSDEGQDYEEGKKKKSVCVGGSPTRHKNTTADNLKGKFLYESRQQF